MKSDLPLTTPTNDPESDLAYALQHAPPGDSAVLEVLLERYGADLYRLVLALLETGANHGVSRNGFSGNPMGDFRPRAIKETATILVGAAFDVARFWGFLSPRLWIYDLALQRFGVKKGGRFGKNGHNLNGSLTALLYYNQELPLDDLSVLLNRPADVLHSDLDAARMVDGMVANRNMDLPCVGWQLEGEPQAELSKMLDGMVADPYRLSALRAHLNECVACRRHFNALEENEIKKRTACQALWPAPAPAVLAQIKTSADSMLAQPPSSQHLAKWSRIPLQGVVFIVLLIVALVFTAWWLAQNEEAIDIPVNPEQSISLNPGALRTPAPRVSPIAQVAGNNTRRLSTYAGPNIVWSMEPDLSIDGRYVVFSSNAPFWVQGDANGAPDVFIFDRERGEVQRISVGSARGAGGAASYSPSIDGAGEQVVYVTERRSLLPPGSGEPGCVRSIEHPDRAIQCGDILLYNRLIGETTRLTLAGSDEDLNGFSRSPVISANGRFIAFWSTASNLAGVSPDLPPTLCPPVGTHEGPPGFCFDVYVMNLDTKVLIRIPVGRLSTTDLYNQTYFSLSFSSNGTVLGLTIGKDDLIAGQMDLKRNIRAFLVDISESSFGVGATLKPVDQLPGLAAPNGNSYLPALSADGRYALFVSRASNLVDGDTNNEPDVFLLDQETNAIRRVSVATNGKQLNGPSGGLLSTGRALPMHVSIDGDGRYIAFLSAASDLFPENEVCWRWSIGELCGGLFLHDVAKNETKLITLPDRKPVFHTPKIALLGGWLVFSEASPDCRGGYPYEVCGDVWLYDIDAGQAFSLSQGRMRRWSGAPAEIPVAESTTNSKLPTIDDFRLALSSKPNAVQAHSGPFGSLAVSSDGRLIATGGKDAKLKLWDAETLTIIEERHIGTSSPPLAFSPDAFWLAAGLVDGRVMVYRTDEQTEPGRRRAFHILYEPAIGRGNQSHINTLGWSPDGQWLAVGGGSGLQLWMRNSNFGFSFQSEISDKQQAVTALAFSPVHGVDGPILAYALVDGTIKLASLLTGNVSAQIAPQSSQISAMAYDHTGGRLAVGYSDGGLAIWSLEASKAKPEQVFMSEYTHVGGVMSIVYTADDQVLVSTGASSTLLINPLGSSGEDYSTHDVGLLLLTLNPNNDRLIGGRTTGELVVFTIYPE